jgi:phage gp45-like
MDSYELRALASKFRTDLRNTVRRVAIGVAGAGRLWQFLGYIGAEGERETFDDVEVFQGIGFASRPKAGQGEAVVLNVGGAPGHAVAAATRARESEPEDLEEDETQVHNTVTQVRVTKAGVVAVTDRLGGVAIPLATKADVDALVAWVKLHTHGSAAPGSPTTPPLVLPAPGGTPLAPSPVGTTKLKAQ